MSESLESALAEIEAGLGGGTLGVSATFLPTGEAVEYRADETFPTASVIKIAIVAELFTQAGEGRLDARATVEVTPESLTGGSGVLAQLTPGLSLPLADLATLTISVSDNTASNLCLAAVGGPEAVNRRMREAWGMTGTTVHRPIRFDLGPDDPPHTATGTPRDMHRLLVLLAGGQVHSSDVSGEVLRRMALVRDGEKLTRYLDVNPYAADVGGKPPFTARRKTGEVTGVRNDAGLISRGDQTLAVCVYTKGTDDPRWTAANRGSEAVGRVGELLCRHYS